MSITPGRIRSERRIKNLRRSETGFID